MADAKPIIVDSRVQLPQQASPNGQVTYIRAYKACTPCRLRKVKCDIGEGPTAADNKCSRCRRNKVPCTFEPIPKRKNARRSKDDIRAGTEEVSDQHSPSHEHSPPETPKQQPEMRKYSPSIKHEMDINASTIASASLASPADVIGILNQVEGGPSPRQLGYAISSSRTRLAHDPAEELLTWRDWGPVHRGHLTAFEAGDLLEYYFSHMHDYSPIAQPPLRTPTDLSNFIAHEQLLPLVIIMIAAHYRHPSGSQPAERTEVIAAILFSEFKSTVGSVLFSTSARTIGTVEALLLMCEWAPKSNLFMEGVTDEKPQPSSVLATAKMFDELCHMCLGTAIRVAQLLDVSEIGQVKESRRSHGDVTRRVRVWLACVQMDRHHAIRLNRSFCATSFSSQWQDLINKFADRSLAVDEAEREQWQFKQAFTSLSSLLAQVHELFVDFANNHVKAQQLATEVLEAWVIQHQNLLTKTTMQALRLKLEYQYNQLFIYTYALQDIVKEYGQQPASLDLISSPSFPYVTRCIEAAKTIVNLSCIDLEEVGYGLTVAPVKYWLRPIYAAIFLVQAACIHKTLVSPEECRTEVQKVINLLRRYQPGYLSLSSRYAGLLDALLRRANVIPDRISTPRQSQEWPTPSLPNPKHASQPVIPQPPPHMPSVSLQTLLHPAPTPMQYAQPSAYTYANPSQHAAQEPSFNFDPTVQDWSSSLLEIADFPGQILPYAQNANDQRLLFQANPSYWSNFVGATAGLST